MHNMHVNCARTIIYYGCHAFDPGIGHACPVVPMALHTHSPPFSSSRALELHIHLTYRRGFSHGILKGGIVFKSQTCLNLGYWRRAFAKLTATRIRMRVRMQGSSLCPLSSPRPPREGNKMAAEWFTPDVRRGGDAWPTQACFAGQ